MSEWKELTLGDVITLQRGHDLPKSRMQDGNIPVAGSNGIIGWHNVATTKAPGITIGRSGNLGNAYLYKEDFWAHNTTLYVKDFKGNDEKFVYYLLKTMDFKQFNVGSAVPTLNRNHIHPIGILLPPLSEQKAIAEVLSSLDDKIDLLHRQNKTLEQMAETLFRQWFVEEAEDDWEEKPLSYIANFLNGLACQKYPPKNEIEKLPVLKIRELSNGISEASDWATSNVNTDYIVELGDVIFSWSASLMVKIWDGERCVLNQHLFKVTSEKYPKWFYLGWCKHHLDEFISISASHATTMGHIKRSDLDNAMVLIPSDKELNVMTEIMEPIIEKKITNYKQLSVLKKLRDTLLPKLMSGEISVKVDE
ncbi:MAG: restriction endonuclease subunit S [Spirochaetes bacterium]|nr:restriction endonuclease subunit S [Spirochaetota bacterium]MBN2771516.1 restriction endonuclease subunit S [Spirochaetota bacterium]